MIPAGRKSQRPISLRKSGVMYKYPFLNIKTGTANLAKTTVKACSAPSFMIDLRLKI
jgi:hypothetical protein